MVNKRFYESAICQVLNSIISNIISTFIIIVITTPKYNLLYGRTSFIRYDWGCHSSRYIKTVTVIELSVLTKYYNVPIETALWWAGIYT